MLNDVKIAISGKSGCGNSTVSGLVAKRLGLELINYTFKSIAEEMNISFAEVCRRAEEDSSYAVSVPHQGDFFTFRSTTGSMKPAELLHMPSRGN